MISTQLIGNIASIKPLHMFESGKQVLEFNLAVPTGYNNETRYFTCKSWGKQAETLAQYVEVGHKLFVGGRIEEPRAYLDKEGNPRAQLVLTVRDFSFLTSKAEGERLLQQRNAKAAEAEQPVADKPKAKVAAK